MISNLARADGGPELIHELSRPHPGYRERETEQKIEHALQDGEPHTCQYIQQNLGFTGCPEGGCGVKAPIGFVSSPVVLAKLKIESCILSLKQEPKRDTVFDDDVIGALAVLKKREPAEYAKAKGTIKDICGKLVSLNDLEKAVKQRQIEDGKLRLVQDNEPETLTPDWMSDAPMEKAVKPRGYRIGEDGITTTIWMGDDAEEITVFPAPVLLSKRYRSIDDGREKVELAYRWDGEWNRLVVDADIPFTASKIVTLRKEGFPVSSETAKHLVKYLDAFVAANRDTIPIQRSVSHMGWVGTRHFLPGIEGDIHLDVEPGGTAAVAAGYRQQGTLEEWIRFIEPVREYPIARFTLAAAFAAPLMALVNQRVFVVHNWGPSRGGKTATLKAALSVWGEPETIMASFNATKVGLERLAGFYSDLPLGIDERQVVGDKQGFVESLVYMLGLGKGKARGAKGGGLQAFQSWRTIALTTGEEPLSSDSSTAGIKTRALEIHGVPIEDEKLARSIHQGIAENYGVAGPAFVKRVMDELDSDPHYFKEDYANMMKEWEEKGVDALGSHLSALTTVMLADYYASMWIFGKDEITAMQEARQLADTILSKLDTGQQTDDAVRAMEYLVSWYHVNKIHFSDEPTLQWYGMWTQEGIAIFPTAFEKAMKEGGFNSRRILSDWADRGWIETESFPGDNKRRMKIRKQIRGTRYQVILVRHEMMRELEQRPEQEEQGKGGEHRWSI
jgi:putative DNA primase/helicase